MSGMSDPSHAPTVAQFLEEQVKPRYAALVADAERQVAEAERALAELRGAAGTMCWLIEGCTPLYFNFDGGTGTVADEASGESFMTVRMSAGDWERFASGQVGGFMQQGGNRGGLGKTRMEKLKPLRGTLRFALTGLTGGDWCIDLGINGAPVDPPTATVSMLAEVASEIQAGTLNPQMAFMQGKVKVLGDAGLVMQFGMAMFM